MYTQDAIEKMKTSARYSDAFIQMAGDNILHGFKSVQRTTDAITRLPELIFWRVYKNAITPKDKFERRVYNSVLAYELQVNEIVDLDQIVRSRIIDAATRIVPLNSNDDFVRDFAGVITKQDDNVTLSCNINLVLRYQDLDNADILEIGENKNDNELYVLGSFMFPHKEFNALFARECNDLLQDHGIIRIDNVHDSDGPDKSLIMLKPESPFVDMRNILITNNMAVVSADKVKVYAHMRIVTKAIVDYINLVK